MFQVNHPLLFALAALVIAFVMGQSLFFLLKAWRQAKVLGIPSSKLKNVLFSTAIFTIAPSLAILLGLVTLSKFLGLPLPWLRLSVLGALTYELPAATTAAKVMGLAVSETVQSATVYSAIAWVMTLGILSGIFVILFGQKRMQKSLQGLKAKDAKWGQIFMDSLFMGMIAAFLGLIFADVRSGLKGYIPIFVLLCSALLMAICALLIKRYKQKWLENYAMPFAMLGAMAFAVLLSNLLN